jgi:hypothetical protein
VIRISEIQALLGLVGFRQSTITAYAILDAGNLASSSGLYVNDISALITTKNIKSCHEDKDISNANFNTFLDDRQKSSLVNLCNAVFSESDLIENRVLYNYENDFITELTNDTSFVGYEIDPAKSKDLALVINKVMLEFSTIDSVKVLLFHSSKNASQQDETITTVADSAKHTAVGWDLPLFNSVVGGKWYVGYLRSGLTATAYDRNYDSANVQSIYNMFGIEPIQVADWDAETLFDVNDIEYTDKSYGMNFDITSYKDFTSLIVENKNRFAKALQLQIAADLLTLIATTTRSNTDERIINGQALLELNGERPYEGQPVSIGVLKQLKNEIKELKDIFINPPKLEKDTLV